MSVIIARTESGGRDLCIGRDWEGATIVSQESNSGGEDYRTTLVIKDVRGFEHKLIIVQER